MVSGFVDNLLQKPIVMSRCLFLVVLWHVYLTDILYVRSCHVSIHAAVLVKTQDPFSLKLSSVTVDDATACGRKSVHPSLIQSSSQLNTLSDAVSLLSCLWASTLQQNGCRSERNGFHKVQHVGVTLPGILTS